MDKQALYKKQDAILKKRVALNSAKLRLAFLKENFHFRDFYRTLKNNPKQISSLGDCLESFELNRFYCFADRQDCPIDQLLILFDRDRDFDPKNFSEAEVPGEGMSWRKYFGERLPELFVRPILIHVVLPGQRFEHYYYRFDMPKTLKPWERVLIVDARARKEDLLGDFELFIDRNRHKHEHYKANEMYSYVKWEPEKERETDKAWVQLDVWKRRRMGQSLFTIAQELKLSKNLSRSKDLARYYIYRAYEISQGEKYDKNRFKKMVREEAKKRNPFKICSSCPDKNTCQERETCPRFLEYLGKKRRFVLPPDHISLWDSEQKSGPVRRYTAEEIGLFEKAIK